MVLLFPSMHVFPGGARLEAALDIVTLTTMEWAIWQTGEPVVICDKNTDLTGVKKLAICGHGAPGSP